MDSQQLRTLLEQLHGELKEAQSVDEEEKQLLHDLMRDIQNALARSGDESLYLPLTQQLAQALKHFEVSHPKLTLAIGQALDILSGAGF